MVVTDMAAALLGGVLIGLSAMLMMLFNGRVAGITGIIHGAFKPLQEGGWRLFFIAGLIISGVIAKQLYPQDYLAVTMTLPLLLVGGFLVGAGARYGRGCTSGHGVCGVGRLSMRSMVATGVFMTTAVVSAIVFH